MVSIVGLALVCGCGRKDAAEVAPAASSLAVSAADPSQLVWRYSIDPKSTVHVELPGLKELIKADATGATGALDVVGRDLARSRGQVRIDLQTFRTSTFGTDKDAAQTKHARTWLEVEVEGKVNEEMRWAEFAIRSLDDLSANDLTKVSATHLGSDDVRTVTMTVHGELLVHGHRVPKDDAVEVSFHYSPGAAPDAKPRAISVSSKKPMRVVLKEHDVRPRDPAGQLLEWTTNLLSKVADTADVTFQLGAGPAS
jgi:hypothetical protein